MKLLEQLQTYCLSKPAALLNYSTRSGLLELHVFGEVFARFDISKTVTEMLLYVKRDTFSELQKRYKIVKEAIEWRKREYISYWAFPGDGLHFVEESEKQWTEWTRAWILIPLDAGIAYDELRELIDESHEEQTKIFYQSKWDREKFELAQQPFSTTNILAELAKRHFLQHKLNDIKGLLEPAISMKTHPLQEYRVGQSRLGGLPDLPPGQKWCEFEGKPLGFVGQINLANIPDAVHLLPLPKSGILYFFSDQTWADEYTEFEIDWYQTGTDKTTKVVYFDGDMTTLRESAVPDGLRIYDIAGIEFVSIMTLPAAASYSREKVVEDLNWTENEYNRLREVVYQFRDLQRHAVNYPAGHQFLGYRLVSNGKLAASSRLLLAVYPDPLTRMYLEDGGVIYFTIQRDNLEKRDFSSVSSSMESG